MSKSKKIAPLFENMGEATAACLITMVQGNLLILGLSHWLIASQTGVLAGLLATAVVVVVKTANRLVIAIVLGIVTGVVDYFVHDGMFGPEAAEAIVTGLGAAFLSYFLGLLYSYYKLNKQRASGES